MTNTADVSEVEAVYGINRYLLSDPTFADLMGWSDGDQLPFFPVQSQPESVPPYIRYTVNASQDGDAWWLTNETIAYAISEHDITKSAHIANVMKDLLQRLDESARELQKWLEANGGTDYLYRWVSFESGGNLEPPIEEGGVHQRMLVFRYSYSPKSGSSIT